VPRLDIHNSELPIICQSCEARHKGVCGALSPQQLTALSKHTRQVTIDAGTELIADQEPISQYANILSGVIKLTKLFQDGRQQIVGLQFAPDLLGRPFQTESNVGVEAATSVKLCTFPRSALEKAIRESPALSSRLHEQALRELDEAREWMLTLGRKTAREKVASFLRLVATSSDPERHPNQGTVIVELPLTRSAMADFLGLTIETVSRQMTALRKEGIIDMEKSQLITVTSLEALNAASGY
jgi:CRP/FNR family transcriptional regulator